MNQLPLWAIRYLYIGLAAAYFILPWDFDMAGFIGRIDDLAVIGFLYYRYQKRKKEQTEIENESTADTQSDQSAQESHSQDQSDPYSILGVSRDDALTTIEKRYKELARQYHPDRVNHLGPELQEMAHQKMLAIQGAYETLKKHHV